MLTRTFCHIPGIGLERERRLWAAGICCWDDAGGSELPLTPALERAIRAEARRSTQRLARRDARYFARHLPSHQQWRLFDQFRDSAAFLDIETTGLGGPDDYVTAIALYDGQRVRHYVCGENLDQFETDVAQYDLLVTYNGKSFDVPFIGKFMNVRLDQAHVDLMYVLRSLGYTGGLKAIERRLGYERSDMADIDGFFAVVLWHEYQRTDDRRVLETLLAYNVQDVLNLEPLMAFAFNRKLEATPFTRELHLPEPTTHTNPFRVHREVVDRLKRQSSW